MKISEVLRKVLETGVATAALREAKGDLLQVTRAVEGALRARYEAAGRKETWPYLEALFADRVVVREDGVLFAYPYTIREDGTAELGEPRRAEEHFTLAVPASPAPAPAGAFLEARDGQAGRYRIRVIRAGRSGNDNYYPDKVLREAVPLFEGVRVFVKGDEEHLAGKGKDFRNLIGRLSDVVFVEGKGPDAGEIQATLELIEPEGPVGVKLREAWAGGMAGLFGFSIDAVGPAKRVSRDRVVVREAAAIAKVQSVDLIVEAGAGGEVINMLEAQAGRENIMKREELIALLEAKGLLTGKNVEAMDDGELVALLREAVQPAPAADAGKGTVTREDLEMVDARAAMREAVAASGLPDPAKLRLRNRFGALDRFTEADVRTAIKEEREYLAHFTESGRVTGLGEGLRIEGGESRAQKVERMLDAFFDPNDASQVSFKEAYVQITGDSRVTGQLRNCDMALLRESLAGPGRFAEAVDTSTYSLALGDAIHRRLVKLYRAMSNLDAWRVFSEIGMLTDFREHHRVIVGGYGDLPVVLQGHPYLEMATPTDEEATLKAAKRGGTESITLEAIRNDDVGAIRNLPVAFNRSAKRTLSRGVFSMLLDNKTVYDGKALFDVDHGNLKTAALADGSYSAGRLAMMKQTEPGSGEPLNFQPKYLGVPVELEEAASNMFRRDTNQDETFLQSNKPTIVPIWCATDGDNWYQLADKEDMPFAEVSFLDGNEEPEILVQDSPNAGSMFSHDRLTYRVRHIWAATCLNWRAAIGHIVP